MPPGRLKIFVPLDKDFNDGDFRDKVLQKLKDETSRHHEYDITSTPKLQRITDDFGFETVLYHVDVACEKWQNGFLQLSKDFCYAAKGWPAVLEVAQNVFFKVDFFPIDVDIYLHSVSFGNLLNATTFVEHHLQKSIYRTRRPPLPPISTMKVEFQHDEQEMKLEFDDRREGEPLMTVQVSTKYAQIQRIVVDTTSKNAVNYITMYFYLSYPSDFRWKDREKKGFRRCLTWRDDDSRLATILAECPVLSLVFVNTNPIEIYNILSRLRTRTNVVIEFAHVKWRSGWWFHPNPTATLQNVAYPVLYMLEAILSRGAIVKDILLASKDTFQAFATFFQERHRQEPEVTLFAMEKILAHVSQSRELRGMRTIFKKLFDQAKSELPAKKRADKKLEEEGYELVRKVIVTPSRMLLIAPELGMGNRGIRDFTSSDQDVIRVHFREHDGDKLRENRCGKELIEKTVGGVMQNGLKIAGKKYVYFGNSSSQLRDNGCYFFAESIIQEVREKIGSFKDNTSVPKRMSRIGQFFTQAQRLKDNVQREQYRDIHDYLGGCDPSGAPYTFSDGVGMISQKFAEEVAEDLGLEGHVPSCFQIRFRGFKGVLSVNPVLDIIPTKLPLHFCFRESQKKFFAFRKKTTGSPFEIVKYSSPCSVSLNKPVLNILDQVSEKQSLTTHRRIMKRVHELLDKQIDALALGLTSEQHCREKLAEMSLKIDVERLDYSAGFQLTAEPFFRSLLQALCRNSIRKIRTKNSIQIPPHFGRTLFGIVDESGQLQYGQIYCQVTENVHVKNPKKSAPKKVIKGRVLMSKNPAIIGGDVRVFEAVDVPELSHLVDVVVFPRYGPRPHPDEMAGSDLDGDEYTLIWDKNLLLDYNERAMDFPKAKAKVEEIKEDQIVDKFREFFVDYVRNDSVGQLSVAHLAVSDLYGLDCQPSNNLAIKIAKALDFSKTGESPSQIRGEGESPAINPDFLEKRHRPSGRSPGLNGQIYRRAKEIDDILRKCMSASEQEPVELDPDLMTTGWKEYEEDAKKDFANYAGQIRTILDKYGVENEAQLFSGSIIEFRRRVGEICTDKNDMYGSFNVFANIDRLVSGVFYSFRTAFFELFGVHDENGFICQEPSEAMRKLASAYYVVTYRAAKDNEPDRLLSFPWVVWDVLAVVKRKNYVGRSYQERFHLSFSPFATKISNHLKDYSQQQPKELRGFKEALERCSDLMTKMCRRYEGLEEILFFVCTWAEENALFLPHAPLQFDILSMIVALFGMAKFKCSIEGFHAWFDDNIVNLDAHDSTELKNLHARFGGVGSLVLNLMKFWASREFEELKSVHLTPLNLKMSIDGRDLKLLHKAAKMTYNELIFSNSCDPFPQASKVTVALKNRIYEKDAFTIDIPKKRDVLTPELEQIIKAKTQVTHIKLRPKWAWKEEYERLVVSAIGSLEALAKLENLLIGDIPMRSFENHSFCDKQLPKIILEKILKDDDDKEDEDGDEEFY